MTGATPIQIAQLEIAIALARRDPDLSAYRIATAVLDLARLARSLHRRYEASCSFAWANTDAYARQTDRLEARTSQRAQDLGLELELQRDPRGWPLILRIDGRAYRLGG